MVDWTITAAFNNNTEYTLYPSAPPTAEWYGYPTKQPDTIKPNSSGVNAGVWRAKSGTWTGITCVSCYVSPDPNQMLVLLSEMPYSGPNNNSRVAVKPTNTSVNQDMVEEVWNNSGSVNVKFSGTDRSGKEFELFLNSSIEQGSQVTATFILEPVGDN